MSVSTNFLSVYFPYCIKKQEDGNWVVCNRQYKPVGFNTSDFINYEDLPVSSSLKGFGPGTANKISCSGVAEGDTIHLYNDGCHPLASKKNMDLYLGKLAILSKLSIDRLD